jgi:uroporphyrin-3 C-methyltransferase
MKTWWSTSSRRCGWPSSRPSSPAAPSRLLAALKSADQRLSRAAQPRLNPLQRAIAKDMDRIKAATLTDVPVLMLKLDELARMADELPVANAMVANNSPAWRLPRPRRCPGARRSAPAG